jgi:hypothetical protein
MFARRTLPPFWIIGSLRSLLAPAPSTGPSRYWLCNARARGEDVSASEKKKRDRV